MENCKYIPVKFILFIIDFNELRGTARKSHNQSRDYQVFHNIYIITIIIKIHKPFLFVIRIFIYIHYTNIIVTCYSIDAFLYLQNKRASPHTHLGGE